MQRVKKVKQDIVAFKKGEMSKRKRVFAKYQEKLIEVGDKFNLFVAQMSQDIAHGAFFMQQNKNYPVNIGAGGNVNLSDLLAWINCVIKPTSMAKSTTAKGEPSKASGFLNNVIHQSVTPTISFTAEDNAQGPDDAQELSGFLLRDNYNNYSKVGAQVR